MKTTIERFGDGKFKLTNSFGETAYVTMNHVPMTGESVKFKGANGPVTRQIGEVELIGINKAATSPRLNEGQTFCIGNTIFTITQIATFSGEPHYGFTYAHERKAGEVAPKYGCGWMPIYFVENCTSYTLKG